MSSLTSGALLFSLTIVQGANPHYRGGSFRFLFDGVEITDAGGLIITGVLIVTGVLVGFDDICEDLADTVVTGKDVGRFE